jgi:hypothetical protein
MRKPALGRLAGENRSGVRECLKAGGDICHIAERDLARERSPHEPDRRLAAVDSDPHRKVRESPRLLDVSGVPPHDLEDPERGSRRTFRVVRVRRRDAEVGADAVALVRLHRAAVLLYRAVHHRDTLADKCFHLVRRELLAESGRAHDVGEEDRHGTQLVAASLASRGELG